MTKTRRDDKNYQPSQKTETVIIDLDSMGIGEDVRIGFETTKIRSEEDLGFFGRTLKAVIEQDEWLTPELKAVWDSEKKSEAVAQVNRDRAYRLRAKWMDTEKWGERAVRSHFDAAKAAGLDVSEVEFLKALKKNRGGFEKLALDAFRASDGSMRAIYRAARTGEGLGVNPDTDYVPGRARICKWGIVECAICFGRRG